MKIHIFALRWKDEIRRSSQLRTLLKQVVVRRTWKKKKFQVLLTTTRFSSVLSCEDLLISNREMFFVLSRAWKKEKKHDKNKRERKKLQIVTNEIVGVEGFINVM